MPFVDPKSAARATLVTALSIACSVAGPLSNRCGAVDQITYRRDKEEHSIEGKLLVKAQDGGLMLLSPDGALWNIEPEEIVHHTHDDRPFAPLTQAEAGKRALAELPRGFDVYTTAHYVICYGTSRAYAQWVGALYERLYTAFTNY